MAIRHNKHNNFILVLITKTLSTTAGYKLPLLPSINFFKDQINLSVKQQTIKLHIRTFKMFFLFQLHLLLVKFVLLFSTFCAAVQFVP